MKTLNQRIKELAFEVATDYKPWEENLEPQKYFEAGYRRGAGQMAKYFEHLHPLLFWTVKVFGDDGFRTYNVPATSARDAQLMAFILDDGCEGPVVESGEMELAKMYAEIISKRTVE